MARKRGETDIATPSQAWYAMEAYRALPRALRGGVLGLQKSAQLFKATRETRLDYQRRLNTLTLEPYYWSACEHLGGQPFTKPPTWSDDTPKVVSDDWAKNVDGSGRNFRSVAWTSCTSSAGMGLQYIFVLWDDDLQRPKMIVLPEHAVLDPKEEGRPVRVRMDDYVDDPKRPWLQQCVEQVWLLFDGDPTASGEDRYVRFEVYEHEEATNPKSPWMETPVDGGYMTNQTTVPLFPLYTGAAGALNCLPWICFPALHELSVLNRSHLNKRSDLDAGLHIANIPQRAASGLLDGEASNIDTVSYKGMWWMQNPSGKFYYVEHTGAAFQISLQDLDSLERKCEVFGLSPMLSKETNNVTATGRLIDLSRATTTAQAWTIGWEDSWTQAWRAAARYARQPDTFSVTFFTDFGPAEDGLDKAKLIQADYLQGDLAPELYYPIMKELGVYPASFDVERAVAAAKAKRQQMLTALASAVPVPTTARTGGAPPARPAIAAAS